MHNVGTTWQDGGAVEQKHLFVYMEGGYRSAFTCLIMRGRQSTIARNDVI